MKLKKLLASFMAACMVATAVPVTAMAEEVLKEESVVEESAVEPVAEEVEADIVAEVGNKEYTSLQDAINACTDGETVKLIKDITYGEADIVYAHGGGTGFGNYDQYNPSIIYTGGTKGETEAENKPCEVDAVIDLNGHDIVNEADAYLFLFMDNAEVTFKDSEGGGSVTSKTETPVIWAVGAETLVTIESGKYVTASATGLLHSTHSADMIIEGGTFETTASDASLLIVRNASKFNNPNYFLKGAATITVTGGTFDYNPEKTFDDSTTPFTEFNAVAKGYAAVNNGNGTWTVGISENAVAKVGDTYYESLQEAINACTDGETVELIKDITYTEKDAVPAHGGGTGFGKYDQYNPSIIYTGGTKGETEAENKPCEVDAVIDLNGHSITNNADAYLFLIMDNAVVTFKDSKGGGSVTNTKEAPVIWAVGTDTTVTIESGEYVTASTTGLLWSTHGADMFIEDGEFATTANDKSLLIVRNEKNRNNPNYFVDGKATISISGGTFEYNPETTYDDSTDPYTKFNAVAEGYVAIDNKDGTWTVGIDMSEIVAEVDGKYYKSLKEAFEAVPTDGTKTTVKILKDIDLTAADMTTIDMITNNYGQYAQYFAAHVVNGQNTVLDMNGHKITMDFDFNELNLSETADYPRGGSGVIGVEDGGQLTVKGNGTLEVDGNGYGDTHICVSGIWSLSMDSEVTIKNGTFIGTKDTIVTYASHGGELYIEGGSFEHSNEFEQSYVVVRDTSCPDREANHNNGALSKLVITGGTFEGFDPNVNSPLYTDEWAVEDVVPEGYKVINNGDGTWTVMEDKPEPEEEKPAKPSSNKSSSSKKYKVDIEDTEDGEVTADRTSVKKGTTVTLTVNPDSGYGLDDLKVLDKDGDEVDVKDNGNGEFTFKMPQGGVTVESAFEAEMVAGAEEEMVIILTIDSVIAWVFDEYVTNDVAPEIKNDRTMLPIRFVVEALGGTVTWDEAAQTVSIVKDDITIEIYINQSFALVNGEPVQLDAPAYIANDRTYLPLRFVAENLGATVEWNAVDRTVTIYE